MNFIIVDDNLQRANEISSLIIENFNSDCCDVFTNVTTARNKLKRKQYDCLILDVILPNLDEIPSSKNGLDFLNLITSHKNYKKPNRIIGITSKKDDISHFRNDFDKCCFTIIEANNTNVLWKKSILDAIKYDFESKLSRSIVSKEIICLSIHGIRTNGVWQQELDRLISDHLPNIENHIFKYGYFNTLLFLVPFFRKKVIDIFVKDVGRLIQNNPDKDVYVFSHSFGTYISIFGLDALVKENNISNLKKIVLSGSVLKSNYDFSNLIDATNVTIVNDCGSSDNILLMSEAIVPQTGMAGRIGFYGLNNNRMVNRFFSGGHSLYFKRDNFMEKYWLPLFIDSQDVKIIDERIKNQPKFILNSLLGDLCSFIGRIYWVSIIVLIVIYFNI